MWRGPKPPKGKTVARTLWVRAIEFPDRIEAKFVEGGGLVGAEKHVRVRKRYTWDRLLNDYVLPDDEVGKVEARLKTGEWVDICRVEVFLPVAAKKG